MRMLRFLAPVVSAIGLIVAAPAHAADPSFLGSSGYGLTPSDQFLGRRAFNAAAHTFTRDPDLHVFKANYGLTDRLEVGASLFDFAGPFAKQVVLNGKYLLLPEARHGVGVTVGAFDITDEFDVDPSFYGYLSKNFGGGDGGYDLVLGVGFGMGIYDDDFFANGSIRLTDHLLGWAEWLSTDDSFNVGARLRIGGRLSFDAAVFDIGGDDDFGFGLTWRSGGR